LPTFLEDGHHAHDVTGWSEPADKTVERNQTRQIVRDAILELPDTYRDVLILRDIQEESTEATARTLGITSNAVKIRLHRARQALRERLNTHMQRGQPA
jgi:DNA-directed RNA polymerase specialized sigma subunit, sigma24 homolog